MKEKSYENKIKQFLESVGVYGAGTPLQNKTVKQVGWYVKIWGGGFQRAGIPDILANVNGKFVAIEVKGKGGKPSVLQEINVEEINLSNGLAVITYPKDFEKLKSDIKGLL